MKKLSFFGIKVNTCNFESSISILNRCCKGYTTQSIYFVSFYHIKIACNNLRYKKALKNASYVFPDSYGFKLIEKFYNFPSLKNLPGTDLVPKFLRDKSLKDKKVYLLGGAVSTVYRAKNFCLTSFPGVQVVGSNDGFFIKKEEKHIVNKINSASPDILLIGMGTPLQEIWIDKHKHKLEVPLCIGVGGLFEYWGNGLRRAPKFFRHCGLEWLWLLCNNPSRWRRCYHNFEFFVKCILFNDFIDSSVSVIKEEK